VWMHKKFVGLVLGSVLAATVSVWPLRGAAPDEDRIALHVLNRVAFGPRSADIEAIRRSGVSAYIDAQLRPDRLPDEAVSARLSGFRTLDMTTAAINLTFARPLIEQRRTRRQDAPEGSETRPSPMNQQIQREANTPLIELAQQKVIRAVYSERQLQEVLTDFWFNHFNVDARKGVDRFLLTEYEREAIRPHVLGRFRDLLGATAKSPAMLFYLDNWMSAAPGGPHSSTIARRGGRGGGGDPTMRRLNALRGLNENYGRELLELHTLGVDGGYTQQDVTEVARAFTGWTIDRPRQGGGTFRFDPRIHDEGAKVVLGHRIDSGGMQDGEKVLDILARHPATARFIATKLVRRFVSDTPPASLVDRMAARFTATDGDLREVVRTMLMSTEFVAPDAYLAKTRTPFEFIVAALRATDADLVNAALIVRQLQQLGMPLYQCQPPTGYRDTADAWTNAGALVARMNFAQALADRPFSVGVSEAGAVEPRLFGVLSDSTRATIARAETAAQRLALTLGSPGFQKR